MQSVRTLSLCAALTLLAADLVYGDALRFDQLNGNAAFGGENWSASGTHEHLLLTAMAVTVRDNWRPSSSAQVEPAAARTPRVPASLGDAPRARLSTLMRAVMVESRERQRSRKTVSQAAVYASVLSRPGVINGTGGTAGTAGSAAPVTANTPADSDAGAAAPVDGTANLSTGTQPGPETSTNRAGRAPSAMPAPAGRVAAPVLPRAVIEEQNAVVKTLALLDRSTLTPEEEETVDLLREVVTTLKPTTPSTNTTSPPSTPSNGSPTSGAPSTGSPGTPAVAPPSVVPAPSATDTADTPSATAPSTPSAPSVPTVPAAPEAPVTPGTPAASSGGDSDSVDDSGDPLEAPLLAQPFIDTPSSSGDLVQIGAPLLTPDAPSAAFDDADLIANPEPASMILLATGLAGVAAKRYRRREKK